VTVLLSVLVVVLVAVVQERSRHLAAILATMPLTAPLAMWIVFSASRGDQRQTADFVGSMVIGSVASLLFVLACWFGLRQEWGFPGNRGLSLNHLAPGRIGSALDRALAALSALTRRVAAALLRNGSNSGRWVSWKRPAGSSGQA